MARRTLLVALVALCTIAVPLTGGALAVGADAPLLQEDGMNDSDGDGGMNDSDDGMDNDSMTGDGGTNGSEGGMENDSMDGDSDMSDGDGMDEDSMEGDGMDGDSTDGMDDGEDMDDGSGDSDDSLPLGQIAVAVVGVGALLGGVGFYVTRE